MPDNVKMLIAERNGAELKFPEEEDFTPENMPFSEVGYTSDNVKDAIVETSTVAGQSRFSKTVGTNGTSGNNDYLEFFALAASDDSPWVVAEPCEIINLSVSNRLNSAGATFTVKKNGVAVADITLPAAHPKYEWKVLGTPVSLVAGDLISVQQTSSPNTNDVNMAIDVKVT
jgi:hypothetical protein